MSIERLSVWAVAQRSPRVQRAGRYLPDSFGHPGKMLPALARCVIETYSGVGDLVVDPMCGIGTTLVEATHLGRDGFGIEYEPRWAPVARANLVHARCEGATGKARVVVGDGRHLDSLLLPGMAGHVALVLTSPPYGPSTHGKARTSPGGIVKSCVRYSEDRTNLAYLGVDRLLDGVGTILAAAARVLAPGGHVVLTARPWRREGSLVDLPGALVRVGERAGLTLLERNVALLAGLRGEGLVARPTFFQLDRVRRARAAGQPQQLIAHEDLLVFGRRS